MSKGNIFYQYVIIHKLPLMNLVNFQKPEQKIENDDLKQFQL